MVSPRRGVVLNLSLSHLVIKLILTSKVEPPPKRLLNLRGNFLRTGGVQEQGASLLTKWEGQVFGRLEQIRLRTKPIGTLCLVST